VSKRFRRGTRGNGVETGLKRFKSEPLSSLVDEYSCRYIITFLSHCLANPPDSFIVGGKDSYNSWKRSNGVTIIIMRINTPGLSAMGKRRGACAAVAFYGNKRKVVAARDL